MFWNKPFSHRRNKDGTIDSICTRRFVAVGTALKESELPKMEYSHTPANFFLDLAPTRGYVAPCTTRRAPGPGIAPAPSAPPRPNINKEMMNRGYIWGVHSWSSLIKRSIF